MKSLQEQLVEQRYKTLTVNKCSKKFWFIKKMNPGMWSTEINECFIQEDEACRLGHELNSDTQADLNSLCHVYCDWRSYA
jgi:hypothetical protein